VRKASKWFAEREGGRGALSLSLCCAPPATVAPDGDPKPTRSMRRSPPLAPV
jgi:hypothetical protein